MSGPSKLALPLLRRAPACHAVIVLARVIHRLEISVYVHLSAVVNTPVPIALADVPVTRRDPGLKDAVHRVVTLPRKNARTLKQERRAYKRRGREEIRTQVGGRLTSRRSPEGRTR